MRNILFITIIICLAFTQDRIVTAGYSYTDMLLQLNMEESIVASDLSSLALVKKSSIGNSRRLSVEPILEANPTHFILSTSAGPDAVRKQLKVQKNIQLIEFKEIISFDMYLKQFEKLATLFEKESSFAPLKQKLNAAYDEQRKHSEAVQNKKRALFIYARGAALLFAGGKETIANSAMNYIGVENAVTSFTGFKPLTPEAVIAADPELIIMLNNGVKSIGGMKGVFKLPGVSQTTAGKKQQIVLVDDLHFLTFSSKTLDELKRIYSVINETK